jgi:hypothetical protein
MLPNMRVATTIDFTSQGETVLSMQQIDPQNEDVVRQFVFWLTSASGKDLGPLNPELTKGYGYALAVAYVASALLQVFPDLRLTLRSYSTDGKERATRWTTEDIWKCIADNGVNRLKVDRNRGTY